MKLIIYINKKLFILCNLLYAATVNVEVCIYVYMCMFIVN